MYVRDRELQRTLNAAVTPGGVPADGYAVRPSLSADGRSVSFESSAADLVPGDTNGTDDVFVHDLVTRRTRIASAGPDGVPGNWVSSDSSLSADGRYVAFRSDATDLLPGRTTPDGGCFVKDLQTGAVDAVHEGFCDLGPRALSDDGSRAVLAGSHPGAGRAVAVVHDRTDGTDTVVSGLPGGRLGEGNSAACRRSPATAATSSSTTSATTWCRATATAPPTSSGTTCTARRSGCR